MSAAGASLRQIKAEFERHGIRSEVQIVEHLAYLLLIQDHWHAIRQLREEELDDALDRNYQELRQTNPNVIIPKPVPASRWGRETLHDLITLLEQSLAASPHNDNLGEFFQREIRSEMLKGTTGSQYPTPYHIADLMAALATRDLGLQVLDPTAGSSGLLVAILQHTRQASLTGYDFDPIWAAIGSANVILHNPNQVTFEAVSALNKYAECENQYDCIVMNPPFGGTRSAAEVGETIGNIYGRSNANVMAAFAIQALHPEGRAAFLLPSGVLYGTGTEANLRRLFTCQHLEAIVTLPKISFQPHSNTEAHLIVLQKRDDEEAEYPTEPVWFCQIKKDGYPEGAERDITEELDSNTCELPRVRDLILQTRQDSWATQLELEGLGEIQTLILHAEDGLSGFSIRTRGENPDVQWETLWLGSKALVKLRDNQTRLVGWLAISSAEDETYASTGDQVVERNWTELIPAQNRAADLPLNWQADQEDLSVSLSQDDNPLITINKDRTSYSFTQDGDHALMACLVMEDGTPLSPWLASPQLLEADKIGEDFISKYEAIAIYSHDEQKVGWVINLTAIDQENEDEQQRAYLFVVVQPLVHLFAYPGNPNGTIAFIDGGWLQMFPGEEQSLILEIGSKVCFRPNQNIQGFAIGPAPWVSTGFRLFGVLVPRSEFDPDHDGRGDFRPSQYLPEPEALPIAHSLDVLAEIRKGQTKLVSKIDALSGTLGGKLNLDENADQAIEPHDWVVDMLNEHQRALWTLLSGNKSSGRSVHFNLTTVSEWYKGENLLHFNEDEINQQIELFTRLGLILRVNIQGENIYRCVTHSDSYQIEGVVE